MPTVSMSFTPDPAYVRTVRTVAVAVARRAGVPAELLDEVRLAIGEACTRAVAVHRRAGWVDPIAVTMSPARAHGPVAPGAPTAKPAGRRRGAPAELESRFTMCVIDRGSPEVARKEQADGVGTDALDEEQLALGVGLALLSGLVADFEVQDAPEGDGTQVRMSWPMAEPPRTARARRRTAT